MTEKIYQRQLTKQGLSTLLADGTLSERKFTKEELQDLFTLNEDTLCETHESVHFTQFIHSTHIHHSTVYWVAPLVAKMMPRKLRYSLNI